MYYSLEYYAWDRFLVIGANQDLKCFLFMTCEIKLTFTPLEISMRKDMGVCHYSLTLKIPKLV